MCLSLHNGKMEKRKKGKKEKRKKGKKEKRKKRKKGKMTDDKSFLDPRRLQRMTQI